MHKSQGRLVIIGAGGFGRETLEWAQHHIQTGAASYDRVALLDDAPAFDRFPSLKSLYAGTLTKYQPDPQDQVVIAVGDPKERCHIDMILAQKEAQMGSVIHPTAIIGANSALSPGAILAPNVVVTTNVKIGRHAHFNIGATIGHDATLGDYVTLSSHTDITGGCQVGDCVFLGSGARILPGCYVAKHTRIGAGSVVMRSIRKTSVIIAPAPKKVIFK